MQQDFFQHFLGGVALERALQRDQLVERHAQREDVGPVVNADPLTGCLLGRHVIRRAREVAGARKRERVFHLGQAEIGHLGPAFRGEHDVGGLHVAVDHARVVGVLERLGHGRDQGGGLAEVAGRLFSLLPELR